MDNLKGNGASSLLCDIFIDLNNKDRTPEEEVIFKKIDEKYGELFEKSPLCQYLMNKDIVKVPYTTFYGRLQRGWSLDDALTIESNPRQKVKKRVKKKKVKEITRSDVSNKKPKKTRQQLLKEERERDIINFIKNDLPLNPRQLEYIKNNAEFAEKLKKEGMR